MDGSQLITDEQKKNEIHTTNQQDRLSNSSINHEPMEQNQENEIFEPIHLQDRVEDVLEINTDKTKERRVYAPEETEMVSEYQESFREKSFFKSRESKIKNKKSRLYKKAQIAKKMESAREAEKAGRDLRANMRRKLSDTARTYLGVKELEDLSDLSMLMAKEGEDEEIIRNRFTTMTEQCSGVSKVMEQAEEQRRAAIAEIIADHMKEIDAISKKKKLTEEDRRRRKDLEAEMQVLQEEAIRKPLDGPLDKIQDNIKFLNRSIKEKEKEVADAQKEGKKVSEIVLERLKEDQESLAQQKANEAQEIARREKVNQKYAATLAERKQTIENAKKEGRKQVLAQVSEAFMKWQLPAMNLFKDEDVANFTQTLEKNTKWVDIFRRMMTNNPDYFARLDAEKTKAMKEKLDYLETVSNLYRVRKLIITDPYYSTHYNSELSMEVTRKDTPEKKYLAKLLRASFYLGKNLRQYAPKDGGVVEAKRIALTAKSAYSQKSEKKMSLLSNQAQDWKENREEDREAHANTVRNMVYELEFERDSIPPDSELFNPMKVANSKIRRSDYEYLELGQDDNAVMQITRVIFPESVDKIKAVEKVYKEKRMDPVHSLGFNSKRWGNFTGGDNMNRLKESFAVGVGEKMTMEEYGEFLEYINAIGTKREFSEFSADEQKMREDQFLYAYRTYVERVYNGSKWVLNVLGDMAECIHTEDLIKLYRSKEFRRNLNRLATTSTNMTPSNPYAFLKTFSKEHVDHLKNFSFVTESTGNLQIIANQKSPDFRRLFSDEQRDQATEIYKAEKQALKQTGQRDLERMTAEQAQLDTKIQEAKNRVTQANDEKKRTEAQNQVNQFEEAKKQLTLRMIQKREEITYLDLSIKAPRNAVIVYFSESKLHGKFESPEGDYDGKKNIYDDDGTLPANIECQRDVIRYLASEENDGVEASEEEIRKYKQTFKSRRVYDPLEDIRLIRGQLTPDELENGFDKKDPRFTTFDQDKVKSVDKAIRKRKAAIQQWDETAQKYERMAEKNK